MRFMIFAYNADQQRQKAADLQHSTDDLVEATALTWQLTGQNHKFKTEYRRAHIYDTKTKKVILAGSAPT